MNSKIAYTQNYWEGENYQLTKNLSTKEIAKLIRERLKKEFPECRFSVTIERFTGGSSITVSLMSTPFEVFELRPNRDNFSFLTEFDFRNSLLATQHGHESGYAQLNHYNFLYSTTKNYSNGVFLTEKAYKLLRKAVKIVESFNYDDSDGMIDYFHTRFYFHLNIGKWDKPFRVKGVK